MCQGAPERGYWIMARTPKASGKTASKAKSTPKGKPEDKPIELSPEELAGLKPLDVPIVYASSFRLQGSGNDFNLIFQRAIPMQSENGLHPSVGQLETVAMVTVSPQSLKDIHILIGGQIRLHEQEFGQIKLAAVEEFPAHFPHKAGRETTTDT